MIMAKETGLLARFMEALQSAEQTRDVEPLVSLFADDAELVKIGQSGAVRGRDQARDFWREYLAVFQSIRSTFTNAIERDKQAALEWIGEGTLLTGKPIAYRGVSVLEFEDNKVHRFRTYYDSAAFLPQGAKTKGKTTTSAGHARARH